MRILIAMLALVASATLAQAQGLSDHLQCYKITDTNRRGFQICSERQSRGERPRHGRRAVDGSVSSSS